MSIEVISFHISLSLTLFLLLNWIGKHSVSSGYITLSSFYQRDSAPAFNLLFRIAGPIIFLIICSSALYLLRLDEYVKNIWMVVVYYFTFRILFILALSRAKLMNWGREFCLVVITVLLSWVVYDVILKNSLRLLPEPNDLKNQFWIIIFLFLYSTLNGIEFSANGTIKRKLRYLTNIYIKNKSDYGNLISNLSTDELSESLIYSILLFEQFNRPKLARSLERLLFPWFSSSLGPMQVSTKTKISDKESVKLGSLRVMSSYVSAYADGTKKASEKQLIFDPITNALHRTFLLYRVSSEYNKDDDYLSGIQEMHSEVIDQFYPGLKFTYPHWSEGLI